MFFSAFLFLAGTQPKLFSHSVTVFLCCLNAIEKKNCRKLKVPHLLIFLNHIFKFSVASCSWVYTLSLDLCPIQIFGLDHCDTWPFICSSHKHNFLTGIWFCIFSTTTTSTEATNKSVIYTVGFIQVGSPVACPDHNNAQVAEINQKKKSVLLTKIQQHY